MMFDLFKWLLPIASRNPKTTVAALVAVLTFAASQLGFALPPEFSEQLFKIVTVIGLWCAADGKDPDAPDGSGNTGGGHSFNTWALLLAALAVMAVLL